MAITSDEEAYQALIDLFRTGRHQSYQKGDIILRGDDGQPQCLYYLEKGYVQAYSINNRGEQYVHLIYGPGDILPLSMVVNVMERNIYCEALSDTSLYCYAQADLLEHARQDLSIAYGLMLHSVGRLLIYTDRVNNLEYKFARERIAYRLLLLSRRFGIKQPDGSYLIEMPISQKTIANTINASRETVSRELERLQRKGIIGYKHKYVVIYDLLALTDDLGGPQSLNSWSYDVGKNTEN